MRASRGDGSTAPASQQGFDGDSPRTLRWSTTDVLLLAAFAGIFALSRTLGFLQLWDSSTL